MKILFKILLLIPIALFSQRTNSIIAKGRAYGDSISIRYAPTNSTLWDHCNKVGYTIERFTVLKNNLIAENKEKKTIRNALKPLPEAEWKSLAMQNKQSALYAAALYDKTFQVKGSAIAPENLSNQITLNENRFSFALFSADVSRSTAAAAGLLITDKTVNKDEKYLYKIFPAKPLTGTIIDTGYVFISSAEIMPLPPPRDFSAEWGNQQVVLSWNVRYDKGLYTTYEVERSEDGKAFKKSHSAPISNLNREEKNSDAFYRLDSLPENEKQYYYRIRGLNSFGEFGPYSDVLKGAGMEPVSIPLPGIYSAQAGKNGILIQWKYPDSLSSQITGFKVLRTSEIRDQEPESISSLIPKDQRQYLDAKPKRKSFYYVQAFDTKGRSVTSFPLLGHTIDSVPPAPPTLILGRIDTAGKMLIRWNPSIDNDVMGYRVFMSNSATDEFIQLTKETIKDTNFIYKVSLNTISESMYVKLVSVDDSYNPSKFSKVIEIKRPDIVPPASPQFVKLSSTEKGIEVKWNNSVSKDVILHVLFRRKKGESKSTIVAKMDSSVHNSTFLDKDVEKGVTYEYTLIAVDEAGLESLPSKLIPVAFADDGKCAPVDRLRATPDMMNGTVTLNWNYADKNVTRFYVYRTEKGKTHQFYARVDNALLFVDVRVKAGTTYLYKVCAVYSNGVQSEFSKEVEVVW